jgi:hypothetical protein
MRCYLLLITLKYEETNAFPLSYLFVFFSRELQMFLSALVDVAGHARRADAAFEIMKDARAKGLLVGTIAYSSLMGACCNVSCVYSCMESTSRILTVTCMLFNNSIFL